LDFSLRCAARRRPGFHQEMPKIPRFSPDQPGKLITDYPDVAIKQAVGNGHRSGIKWNWNHRDTEAQSFGRTEPATINHNQSTDFFVSLRLCGSKVSLGVVKRVSEETPCSDALNFE
jgi:hypothetical protein